MSSKTRGRRRGVQRSTDRHGLKKECGSSCETKLLCSVYSIEESFHGIITMIAAVAELKVINLSATLLG